VPVGCDFWGKFVAPDTCLPLAAHGADVGLVFRALCDVPGFRRALERTAGGHLRNGAFDRLSVLAMLHDVGKANLGFQNKVFSPSAPRAGHIRELAPILDPELCDRALLVAFTSALPAGMPAWFPDAETAYSYLMATFSHHGRPLWFKGERTGYYALARDAWWHASGDRNPMEAIAGLSSLARDLFPGAFHDDPPLPAEARFQHVYVGLLILADWLGSGRASFPVGPVNLRTRIARDRAVIPGLLRRVGLDVEDARAALPVAPFEDLFERPPRPLQAHLDALDPRSPEASLLIAESETGSGKTEAALQWFARLFAAGLVDGLYFALPTRVAARGLYDRVVQTLTRWFPDPNVRPVTLLAVPGYVQADGVPVDRMLPSPSDAGLMDDDEARARIDRLWASERPKRFLAATLAVGTVDQALLSVVRTGHAHLRSALLDRSLLVIDEVHASDAYMASLIGTLLHHHLAVGGRAMLLSATLGASARTRFVAAAGHRAVLPSLEQAASLPYPSVTGTDGRALAVRASAATGRTVRVELAPWAFQPDRVLDTVIDALRAGGRVLAVLNTVARANALLRAAEERSDCPRDWVFAVNGVNCPHHGRFSPQDRQLLDRAVGGRLGPESPAGPVLLIGTQTLEQSLDIDADLLVTDLVPADVFLQRVGRLHRHSRVRPASLTEARCLMLTPEGDLERGLGEHGEVVPAYRGAGYGSVYEDLRALELTRRLLIDRPVIRVPGDNRRLVEGVTHPECLASLTGERWRRHAQRVEGGELASAVAAGYAVVPFHEMFGRFEFTEAGERVSARLGMGSLQLPLDRAFLSPFGETVREVMIPAHQVPRERVELVMVETVADGEVVLRAGERRYRYTRFGLEVMEA
jgi:CRISPR-associated endonuclease/helicase Cas3